MNQTLPLGWRDRPESPNGDRGWRGVNMRLDSSQLPEGFASEAVNVRFSKGVAETRLGSMVLPWLNKITAGTVRPWTTVYGAGVFRDPTSAREYVLLAADGGVYACEPNNAPTSLPLPSGVTITATCRFQQCFDVVVLFRGFDAEPLAMHNIIEGFKVIEPSPAGTGTEEIPPALRSVYAANRLFVANDEDSLLFSDILDYTHYSITSDFRINQGSDDRIVQLSMFGPATIIALKGKSIYRVDNVYGDLAATTLSKVTDRYGCAAAESVTDCGSDLLWLAREGVASLTLTERNEVQSAQGALAGRYRMLSEDIQPLVDRINWRYASAAVGALWNDRYYLAVPLDGAEVFGPELSGGGAIYDAADEYVVGNLVAGATYRWVKGDEQTIGAYQLLNGSQQLTYSQDFVAAGTSVTLYGIGPVTASIKRVYKGVNNVTLVYDFQNAAWAGYDEAEGIAVSQFIKARYNDRERLFALTHDGYVRLMEEDYTDRLSMPYVDVVVHTAPFSGAGVLRVNGGTNLTAAPLDSQNTAPSTWGVFNLSAAVQNLWVDSADVGGYYPGSGSPWTAPDTLALKRSDGIRFYGTNGVLPTVVYDEEIIRVTDVVQQDIPFRLVTRGYQYPTGQLAKFSGVAVDVQTWSPTLTVTVLADGVNEDEVVVSGSTRDRTRYTRVGVADYDQTNAAGGFYDPFREDYSIKPTDAAFAFTPGTNIYGHLHQESREQSSANTLGRSARIQIVNTTGRVRVMQASVAMLPQAAPAGSTT